MREQLTDEQLVDEMLFEFRSADIDDTTKAMLEFAVKETESAHTITSIDLDTLRDLWLTDETLFAIVELVGFFCYVNRIANTFGVELDDLIEVENSNESKG